ncbi:MAG TPA: PAC2 family protein [Dehalococcoidales bacterium]|nr:MAG: hypothetical protein A2Z05_02740 [Chloroflexi bacterium RBG_16_60_22]HJX13785.1 PAC2 family protein [Dehalococcoidales bacterium]
MRLGAFEVNEPLPDLKDTHAFAILRPWIDAGNVGSLTLSWLEKHTGGGRIAELSRPGSYFDFTRYRPVIYRSGGRRQVVVPNTFVTCGRQENGPDFLFFHLLEPHMLGETYVESVLGLLEKFDVKRYCLLGSMYDFVPHTRPLPVTGGAEGKKARTELERAGVTPSNYEGPTTILSLVSQRAFDSGVETMTVIVHLPQYTELDEDYIGVLRLEEIVSRLYGVPVDQGSVERAERQREFLSTTVASNPQMQEILEQLEKTCDAGERKGEEEEEKDEPRPLSPKVEEFLREMEKRFRRE